MPNTSEIHQMEEYFKREAKQGNRPDSFHDNNERELKSQADRLLVDAEAMGRQLGELQRLWQGIKTADDTAIDQASEAYFAKLSFIVDTLQKLEQRPTEPEPQQAPKTAEREVRLVDEKNLKTQLEKIDPNSADRWDKLSLALTISLGRDGLSLQGSSKAYGSEDLRAIIEKVKANPENIDIVTNAAGLRDVVATFLEADKKDIRQESSHDFTPEGIDNLCQRAMEQAQAKGQVFATVDEIGIFMAKSTNLRWKTIPKPTMMSGTSKGSTTITREFIAPMVAGPRLVKATFDIQTLEFKGVKHSTGTIIELKIAGKPSNSASDAKPLSKAT